MIKATELRIGNFATRHFEKGEGDFTTCTARDIFDCKRSEVEPDFKFHYEGIELTTPWLERFGFTKGRKQVSMNIGGELFNYWNGPVLLWEVKEGVYTLDSVFRNPNHGHPKPSTIYTTVHSLQNLTFAITGRELELKK